MKPRLYVSLSLLFPLILSFGQGPLFDLTFTASYGLGYIQLDSIQIINRDRYWCSDTFLYWPDTVFVATLLMDVAEQDYPKDNLRIESIRPNPAPGHCSIDIYVPENEEIQLYLFNIKGSILCEKSIHLNRGGHSFGFSVGMTGSFLVCAQNGKDKTCEKIILSEKGSK